MTDRQTQPEPREQLATILMEFWQNKDKDIYDTADEILALVSPLEKENP